MLNKKDLRIVFMGTPNFAKASLEALVDNGFNVVGVFSQPDKPSGRGMKIQPTVVKEYALSKSIDVYQPEKLKAQKEEVLLKLQEYNPDVIVVVAYGKILPEYILNFPKFGCINVHGSILPKYRGAAPIQWSIINGDKQTGVTTMYMDEGMDTGNMIETVICDIDSNDTYGTLHDKLMVIGGELLVHTMDKLCENDGKLDSIKQSDNFTIAPMLSLENTHIDFNSEAETIINLVRGTNPFPTAWCKKQDETVLKIYEAHKVEKEEYKSSELGEVVHLNDKKNLLYVKVKDGIINIDELKAPGSRQMKSGDFIRGNKIKLGDVLK
ncbi:MAG: methionyl-tRNA formyltransferase [Clostridia bacterium]|nr:methionyl-tRNA formyltransferase [Clostridia bacterium]